MRGNFDVSRQAIPLMRILMWFYHMAAHIICSPEHLNLLLSPKNCLWFESEESPLTLNAYMSLTVAINLHGEPQMFSSAFLEVIVAASRKKAPRVLHALNKCIFCPIFAKHFTMQYISRIHFISICSLLTGQSCTYLFCLSFPQEVQQKICIPP